MIDNDSMTISVSPLLLRNLCPLRTGSLLVTRGMPHESGTFQGACMD